MKSKKSTSFCPSQKRNKLLQAAMIAYRFR